MNVWLLVLGCQVEVLSDEDDNFQGLFFQDATMKEDFCSNPEILFIDATYKLTELKLSVFLMMVEDSMGHCEVVGVSLLVNETVETLTWLINMFKKNNDTTNLYVVMADKDITERHVIKDLLGVKVLICLFHTLRTF